MSQSPRRRSPLAESSITGRLSLLALPLIIAIAAVVGAPSGTVPAPTSSPTPNGTPIGSFEELLPIKDGFAPDATTIESCAEGALLCLAQAYGNLAYTSGTRAAGERLNAAMAASPTITSLCHPIAHGIGLAAIAREQEDAARAMRDGFPDCGNGFYHGVLLRAFAGLEDAEPETLGLAGRELCGQPGIAADRNLMINCVHGTGHGYMIATAFDMERSIAAAGEIGFASVSQCDNGVFMEVFAPSNGVVSRYLSATNPFAPCDTVSDPDKLECYTYAAGQVMAQAGGANAEALRLCGTAEPMGQGACFANVGGELSGNGRTPPADVVALCRTAVGSGAYDCLNGAARQVAFYAVDGIRLSGTYCAVGGEIAEPCYASIGDLIAFQGIADPLEACTVFPAGMPQTACRNGAAGRGVMP